MMTYKGFSFITLDRSTTLAIFAQATSVVIVIIRNKVVRLHTTGYVLAYYLHPRNFCSPVGD